MADGVISLDDRPAQAALGRVNTGLDQHETKVRTVLDRTGKQWQVFGEGVVRVSDNGKTALDRLLASMEKQSQLAGKSGADKLIAERDILIRKWGEEERAVTAINGAYNKMISAETGGGMQQMGQNLQNFVQSPLNAAKDAAMGLVEKIGPMGFALGGAATAVVAIASAGFQAAKALGEFGVQVRDIELRTGLSAKEVGQFDIAARAVGQDVSVVERAMRGLTTAVEDESKAGEKGRVWLRQFGVDLQGVRDGSVSTAQVLLQVSDGLNTLPVGVERDKAAMDIFKRAGIDLIPFLKELRENLPHGDDFGYNEADIEKFEKLNKDVGQMERSWADLKRQFQEGLVIEVKWVGEHLEWLGKLFGGVVGNMGEPTKAGTLSAEDKLYLEIQQANKAKGHWGAQPLSGIQLLEQQREQALQDLRPTDAWVNPKYRTPAAQAGIARAADLQAQMDRMEQASAAAKASPAAAAAAAPENRLKIAEDLLKTLDKGTAAYERQEAVVKTLEKSEAARVAAMEKQMETGGFGEGHTRNVAASNYGFGAGVTRAVAPGDSAFIDSGFGAGRTWEPSSASRQETSKQDDLAQYRKDQQKLALAGIAAETDATIKLLALRGGEADNARAVAGLRQSALDQEYAITGDIVKWREESLHNELDMRLKIAQQEKEQADEAQKQLDQQVATLQRAIGGLFHTLLTKPQDFRKQLAGTMREAVIKPVSEGLGGMAANVLHPIIYGADGRGGISGAFKGLLGGGKKDVAQVTDENTVATRQNSAAVAALTAVFAGAMGVSVPAIAAPASGGGILSIPAISAPSIGGAPGLPAVFGVGAAGWSSGGGGGGWALSGGDAASTTSAAPDMYNLPISGHPGAGIDAQMAGILRASLGGGAKGGSKPFNLAALKANWGIGGPGGTSFKSVTSSQGAKAGEMAGGAMLAEAGLLGERRGTWGGVAEGAAGGAAIGMSIGGPLGAAIGGVAGFGIGIGEMAAGVQSPENQAKKLVKQIYGISISENTAKQIAGIAQQKFAGNVGAAVRDPETRKMIMLYSEATGQHMPLSASTPQGGSLAEQGGNLYQQATYQNGAAYTFQSSLPVLGGLGGGTYPAAGGPNTAGGAGPALAININGQPITPEFVADQSMAAQGSSYGRTQQAANMQVPGLMVG
jgi:hypothetical protein